MGGAGGASREGSEEERVRSREREGAEGLEGRGLAEWRGKGRVAHKSLVVLCWLCSLSKRMI